jgi:hypothetical protein
MTTVKYTPNPHKKPQLTKEQEDKLMALSDEDLDYSDIPELDEDFWQKAESIQSHLSNSHIINHEFCK